MRKGQKMSDAQCKKISKAHKGKTKPWSGLWMREPNVRVSMSQKMKGNTLSVGVKRSKETLEKMRMSQLGRKKIYSSDETRLRSMNNLNKGKPWNKGKHLPEEYAVKARVARLGKIHSDETKRKMSESRKGSKHWNWISDRTLLKRNPHRRWDSQHQEMWKQVKIRDGRKCRIGNTDCSGKTEIHHILPWRDYPELRYEINNLISLCHFHHPRKHKDEIKMIPTFQEIISQINL